MAKNKYETQFSVYKVDYNNSVKYFSENSNIKITSYEQLEEEIYKDIEKTLSKKSRTKTSKIEDDFFKGLVFKTFHYPSWYGMINKIVIDEIDISNTHISYILSYRKENNIFLLTGGLGSSYISDYTQKNYGLSLLPKILKEDSPVIKTVLENNLSGNKLTSRHSNRNVTTMNLENEMSSIFRELSIELNKEIIKLIGIEIEEEKNKRVINVIAKDSFVLRKSISLSELKIVLDNLIEIEKYEDNFSLGYFVNVKKKGYSPKIINELLISYMLERKTDNFILVGDDYLEYCTGGNKYIIMSSDGNLVYESDKPIEFSELFNEYFKDKINKSMVESFFKCELSVYSDNDMILFPTKIKQCIQGYVENENNVPFFLFNGDWLMFDSKYDENLDKEFKKNYNELININDKLHQILLNDDKSLSEDKYNKIFSESDDIIVAHTIFSNNIELADLIYYDEDNLYLIHNKNKFDGKGARDVMNQVLTSAEFIRHYLLGENKKEIFERYYNEIKRKYPNNKKIQNITVEEFIELFDKLEIYYVVGFMEDFSNKISSNYAKYMTLNTCKKLVEKGYKLCLFSINGNN
ncbi:MAG: hypothetical protein IJO63_03595 [Bacilli bacterium]|nr:hypothetical protein [Bacilli bacterium]